MPFENLLGPEILQQGDQIQFMVSYTSVPLFSPSSDDIKNAFNSQVDINVDNVSADLMTVISFGSVKVWHINATVLNGSGLTAGQVNGDIYNAMNQLFQGSISSGFNVNTFGLQRSTSLAKALGIDTSGIPGLQGTDSGSLFNWSTTVALVAIALLVIAAVYFLKGANVGVHV